MNCTSPRRFSLLSLFARNKALLALLAVGLCAVIACQARGDSRKGSWPGLYTLNKMLTFYLVNDLAENFTVTIRWNNGWQDKTDTAVLVRVLNTDEVEIARHLDPGLKISGTPGWNEFEIPVTASGAGIYQVIVTGHSGMLHFEVSPDISWGVYGYPYLQGTGHLTDAYVYLPPNLTSLNVQCTGSVGYLRLIDENNITHLNMTGSNPSGFCALPPGEDQIWRLTAQASGEVGVTFGVAPIIACPDEETALAIRASVDILSDGTVCYHKFQEQAHDLLQQYAAMDPTEFQVNLPNLSVETPQWITNPTRNQLLLGWYGVYSNLAATLAEQNLDPASPWFGSIRAWHDANGQPRPNPWITYDRLSLWDPAPGLGILAAVHAVDDPLNPLYHDAKLRNRIIIAALRQVMMIREHEHPESTYIQYDGGEKAFNFAYFMRSYPWAVQQCPGAVQSVWTQAARRYADSMMLAAVPEIANQWAFIMMGLQSFAKATGEAPYVEAVNRQIGWLLNRTLHGYGAMQAGYFSDGEGPDASYAGIHMHMLAWLCEDTGHAGLKQAMKDSFRLLNHTIAQEPDGTWLGSTTFNHRTPWDWNERQWTGGVGMMADDSEDAAVLLGRCWMPPRPPRNAIELAAAQQQLQNMMQYAPLDIYDDPEVGPSVPQSPMIAMTIYEHYMGTPLVGQLPMKASNRFTRKFSNEFFAVRRPSYYAMLYTGRQFASWREDSAPVNPDVQYPRNGGGLSILWSPKLGSSIVAENWSAYSSNSIIARKAGQDYFEDYWETDPSLAESQARATVHGQLNDDKMTFRRQIRFQEDRILCEIRLKAVQSLNYGRLWECFPYPLDKPEALEIWLYDAQGNRVPGNNKSASAIVFRNSVNEVHVIAFNEPRVCEFGTHTSVDQYGNTREIGRVLTRLPDEWNAGQVRTVKWAARVVKPNQVKNVIQQLVASQ